MEKPEIEPIGIVEFGAMLKRRRFTIRYDLRAKIQAEDYPHEDGLLLRELRLINKIARMHKLALGDD